MTFDPSKFEKPELSPDTKLYRNATFDELSENLSLVMHESYGVRVVNKDGRFQYLHHEVLALRFSLSPNSYPQYGDCFETLVSEVPERCHILKESGSEIRSVVVVYFGDYTPTIPT